MPQDLFCLDHKIALITGASRGIGEAIAKTLADHGAQVILASRKIDDLKRVEEDIVRQVEGIQYRPAIRERWTRSIIYFDEIRHKFKRLDILVNNAATNPFFGDVLSADEKAWDKTFAVNMKGVFFISQQAAK